MRSDRDVRTGETIAVETRAVPLYPVRQNRYYYFGDQSCYTADEINHSAQIQAQYNKLDESQRPATNYFALTSERRWWDTWTCTKPLTGILTSDSYTLPAREVRDSIIFPLWNYATDMSRQIANWRSDRMLGQNSLLMNDPDSLSFKALQDLFSTILSEAQCSEGAIKPLIQLQSFATFLSNRARYAADMLHFRSIAKSLNEARSILSNCVANKALPQLLSNVITSSQSLGNYVKTSLHFLVNEKVSANFLPTQLGDGNACRELSSPLCKIYSEISGTSLSTDVALKDYQHLNRFYELSTISVTDGVVEANMVLRADLLKKIKFTSVFGEDVKTLYIQTIAKVEAITNIENIFKDFDTILSSIGTYSFAYNYLTQVNTLALNYIQIVSQVRELTTRLYNSANDAVEQVLQNPDMKPANQFFSDNLDALETHVAEKTTVLAQLDTYAERASNSMTAYQDKMRLLMNDVDSGKASAELRVQMQGLSSEIRNLNNLMPGILGHSNKLLLSNKPAELIPVPIAQSSEIEIKEDGLLSMDELDGDDFDFAENVVGTGFQFDPAAAAAVLFAETLPGLLDTGTRAIMSLLGSGNEPQSIAAPDAIPLPSVTEMASNPVAASNYAFYTTVAVAGVAGLFALNYARNRFFANTPVSEPEVTLAPEAPEAETNEEKPKRKKRIPSALTAPITRETRESAKRSLLRM